jgi:hypothetical protein
MSVSTTYNNRKSSALFARAFSEVTPEVCAMIVDDDGDEESRIRILD